MTASVLRTLIVDDEPIARRVLREELEAIAGIELAGEADSGSAAIRAIADRRPDLVFLDLQMPGMGGFDVVRSLRQAEHLPVFVIVTAFDQYAIDAFDAGAIDYLLKPVRHERLAQAVDRARKLCASRGDVAHHVAKVQEIAAGAAGQAARKIVGRLRSEYVLLNESEVLAFEAEGEAVWIITAKQRYQATQTLKALEQRLESSRFRRVHKSVLVNLDHVRRMSAMSSQRWLLTLSNGQELIVSKRLAHNVRDILAW
jgi:two-component system, LytTR family, response regulator